MQSAAPGADVLAVGFVVDRVDLCAEAPKRLRGNSARSTVRAVHDDGHSVDARGAGGEMREVALRAVRQQLDAARAHGRLRLLRDQLLAAGLQIVAGLFSVP